MTSLTDPNAISVIIPALNEEKNIKACINAARQDYPPEQIEIIVVDGGSTDKTLALIPRDVKLIQTRPKEYKRDGGDKILFFRNMESRDGRVQQVSAVLDEISSGQ